MLFKSENSRPKFTLIAGAVFAVGMGQSLIALFTPPNTQNSAEAINQVPQEEIDLEAGYKIVLEREPENQTALEAILQIQLANQDLEAAKPNLETLVRLNPGNEGFKALLDEINQQLTAQEQPISDTPTPAE